ncbi:hypothetical protein LTR10_017090 [Elasticomyces elasticus]|uniref:Uncharacterized protein n=1 Tax=Exophiala sideris TaxID=1016849 RepID=A0ABR0JEK7_9EURO|nr:hypothetical protein LTR10_017090 [Elasticomyces elasticus]KAK5032612.1 hypothetical protein LTS07_004022 [Exophiala sideris]KAK5037208.1 hypothetical protein LTR13_005013 [Exophiala sideris]KAK5062137.1 hypothetical protein LTR69_004495 [Exophiala sideris]KAK5182366.1 hypothetical protein LTR44_005377 [Eurotiomycetes sp. CCFEE 6388]
MSLHGEGSDERYYNDRDTNRHNRSSSSRDDQRRTRSYADEISAGTDNNWRNTSHNTRHDRVNDYNSRRDRDRSRSRSPVRRSSRDSPGSYTTNERRSEQPHHRNTSRQDPAGADQTSSHLTARHGPFFREADDADQPSRQGATLRAANPQALQDPPDAVPATQNNSADEPAGQQVASSAAIPAEFRMSAQSQPFDPEGTILWNHEQFQSNMQNPAPNSADAVVERPTRMQSNVQNPPSIPAAVLEEDHAHLRNNEPEPTSRPLSQDAEHEDQIQAGADSLPQQTDYFQLVLEGKLNLSDIGGDLGGRVQQKLEDFAKCQCLDAELMDELLSEFREHGKTSAHVAAFKQHQMVRTTLTGEYDELKARLALLKKSTSDSRTKLQAEQDQHSPYENGLLSMQVEHSHLGELLALEKRWGELEAEKETFLNEEERLRTEQAKLFNDMAEAGGDS